MKIKKNASLAVITGAVLEAADEAQQIAAADRHNANKDLYKVNTTKLGATAADLVKWKRLDAIANTSEQHFEQLDEIARALKNLLDMR